MKFNQYIFTLMIAVSFFPLNSMAPGGPSSEGFDLVEDYINHDQSAKFGQELVHVYDGANNKMKQQIEQALEVYLLTVDDVRKQLASNTSGVTITKPALEPLTFDRQKMSREKDMKVEGYWAGSLDPAEDEYKGRFPWPKAHEKPWAGKKEFLEKLNLIEASAQQINYSNLPKNFRNILIYVQARGYAPSRLEPGTKLGSAEYRDNKNNVAWPEGYGEYYIGKYNVIPSREFYDYVMNYKVD